jgi:hypothetical protein
MARLLLALGAGASAPALLVLAILQFSNLPVAGKEETAPTITCEVRYHFRERLMAANKEGKKFSAPAYEREALPASTLSSDAEQVYMVQGMVAHLPYRFAIKLGGAAASRTLEVNIVDNDNKALRGYPQRITKASVDGGAKSQEFEIPVTPQLSHTIEQKLLVKNQHLTQVQLIVQMAP